MKNEVQIYLQEAIRDRRRAIESIENMKKTIAFETAENIFVVCGTVEDMFNEQIIVGMLATNEIIDGQKKHNLFFNHDLSMFPYFFANRAEAERNANRIVTPEQKRYVKDKIVCRIFSATVVVYTLKFYIFKIENQLKNQVRVLTSVQHSV